MARTVAPVRAPQTGTYSSTTPVTPRRALRPATSSSTLHCSNKRPPATNTQLSRRRHKRRNRYARKAGPATPQRAAESHRRHPLTTHNPQQTRAAELTASQSDALSLRRFCKNPLHPWSGPRNNSPAVHKHSFRAVDPPPAIRQASSDATASSNRCNRLPERSQPSQQTSVSHAASAFHVRNRIQRQAMQSQANAQPQVLT